VSQPVKLESSTSLSQADLHAIALLTERVTELDGVRPLSEQVMLSLLSNTGTPTEHICAWQGARLVGYANLLRVNGADAASVEIAVDDQGRRLGAAGELLDQALRETSGYLQLWAHGYAATTAQLAESRGFIRVRELYRMRRPLTGDLNSGGLPKSIAIRPFDATRDTDDWLELNARAFVDLPDQGNWTRADLEARLNEDWFDPAGFLLAHEVQQDGSQGALVGFHWTKIHHHEHTSDAGNDNLGEVYVLGIDPQRQAQGLGRALTMAGLRYLQDQGLSEVMLHVESDNSAALATYERLGFTRFDKDTLYRSPVPARPST
jgi:mycothiol synthase